MVLANECVFCGSSENGLTKQHVFGKWLANKSRSDDSYGVATMTREGGANASFPQRPFELVVKVVCGSCNSDWMQKLEARATPLLEQMLDGGPVELRPKQQRYLAAWAAEAAMMFHHVHPDGLVIPKAEYGYLKALQQPPTTTRVFLGRAAPERRGPAVTMGSAMKRRVQTLHIEYATGLTRQEVDSWYKSGGRIYGFTFAFHEVLFQVVGHNLPVAIDMDYPKDLVRQIWPIGSRFKWPDLPPIQDIASLQRSLVGGD